MPGFKPFLAGMLAGGCLAAGALQYHVVRSDEGMYLVPRNPKPSLTLAYADTRTWTDEQWNRYPALVDALKANGASDLLNGDAEKLSLNEIQDAMQESLNDAAPFDLDHRSDFAVNKPVEPFRDTMDPLTINTTEPKQHDGFLDDVRQELSQSFGNDSFSHDGSRQSSPPPSDYHDSLRDTRDRMKSTIDDSGDFDAFSESLNDFGPETGRTIGSEEPYSNFDSGELRRRSFESEANESDAEQSISAPDFDDDDDILNRFAPRSGAASQPNTVADDDSWTADPWAQTSHTTEKVTRNSAPEYESPGWTATNHEKDRDNGLVAGIIDRLRDSAGDAAAESMQRARSAVTNPLESEFNDARDRVAGAVSESVKQRTRSAADWLGESVGDVLQPDSDGLFSPFSERLE